MIADLIDELIDVKERISILNSRISFSQSDMEFLEECKEELKRQIDQEFEALKAKEANDIVAPAA